MIRAEQKPTVRLVLGAAVDAHRALRFFRDRPLARRLGRLGIESRPAVERSPRQSHQFAIAHRRLGRRPGRRCCAPACPSSSGPCSVMSAPSSWPRDACRPEQAAVLAMVLVPVLFYPANYYIHLVCFLPLVISEKDADGKSQPLGPVDGAIAMTLLGMCAAQFIAVLITEHGHALLLERRHLVHRDNDDADRAFEGGGQSARLVTARPGGGPSGGAADAVLAGMRGERWDGRLVFGAGGRRCVAYADSRWCALEGRLGWRGLARAPPPAGDPTDPPL